MNSGWHYTPIMNNGKSVILREVRYKSRDADLTGFRTLSGLKTLLSKKIIKNFADCADFAAMFTFICVIRVILDKNLWVLACPNYGLRISGRKIVLPLTAPGCQKPPLTAYCPPVEATCASNWPAVPVSEYAPPLLLPPPPSTVHQGIVKGSGLGLNNGRCH